MSTPPMERGIEPVKSESASHRATRQRVSLRDAEAWVDGAASTLEAETTPLVEAAGRILVEDLHAPGDVPEVDRAAIDGLAVRAEETVGASAYSPLLFRRQAPDRALAVGFFALLAAGEPLPVGADAVIRLEAGDVRETDPFEIIEPVAQGSEVESAGAHARRGERLLGLGHRLHSHDIGILAAAGIGEVTVIRQPRVRIVQTGRQRLAPGVPPSDANGPLLRALVARDGGIVADLRHADRGRAGLREALAAPGADAVLVVGGTGNGPGDEAAAALAETGHLAIHGLALRPGETAGLGRTNGGAFVALLPDTPAHCCWAYEMLAGRAIRGLGGRNPSLPFRAWRVTLKSKIVSTIGMTEIWPIRRTADDAVQPMPSFATTGLFAAASADGFVIVPEGSEGYASGATVTAYFYSGP
jgi:molybdopterin molybdotransferase